MANKKLENLKLDLDLKLTKLESLIHKPRLYLSDYFFSLRNEIDLQAEELIFELNRPKTNENRDDEIKEEKNIKVSNFKFYRNYFIDHIEFYGSLNNLEKFNETEINEARTILIDKINSYERSYLNYFDLLITSQNDEFNKYLNELKIKVEKYRQLINNAKFNQKLEIYESYFFDLQNEVDDFKRKILNNNTIYFRKSLFNSFGFLIILKGVYFCEHEVKLLK